MSMHGELNDISLINILQMLHETNATCRIETSAGDIYLVDGECVHAESFGVAAFNSIMVHDIKHVHIDDVLSSKNSIHTDFVNLLFASMVFKDEQDK